VANKPEPVIGNLDTCGPIQLRGPTPQECNLSLAIELNRQSSLMVGS
jgi:hypothetical protein